MTDKKYLFIVSPSYAILHQWKTILTSLYKSGASIDFLLPKPLQYKSILNNLNTDNSGLYIRNICALKDPLNPFSITNFTIQEFSNNINSSSFNLQLKVRGILAKVINKYFNIKGYQSLGNLFRRLIDQYIIIKSVFLRNKNKSRWDSILYDLTEEVKLYLLPFFTDFISVFTLFNETWNRYKYHLSF